MVSPLCEGVFLYDDALSHDDNIRTLYQDTLARHFCKAFSQGAFGPFDGWAFDGSHSGDNDCYSLLYRLIFGQTAKSTWKTWQLNNYLRPEEIIAMAAEFGPKSAGFDSNTT
jgi:hypothetical protein